MNSLPVRCLRFVLLVVAFRVPVREAAREAWQER